MTENTTPQGTVRLIRLLQWAMVSFCFLMAISLINIGLTKLNLPGISKPFFYAALATSILALLVHLPAIFFRLPREYKIAAYLGGFIPLMLASVTMEQTENAYHQTKEGAKEKAKRDEERLIKGRIQAERDAVEAAEKKRKNEEQAERDEKKAVKSCLSWGGRFKPLEKRVKNSLHNPDAFEHVETTVLPFFTTGYNIGMTYRAENGFGAIRTSTILAKVDPDTCSLLSTDGEL